MAEAPIIESTASLTTRRRVSVRIQIQEIKFPDKSAAEGHTKICNGSGRPIFLIPISGTEHGDPRLDGTIIDDLVKIIPARKSITVDTSSYNTRPHDTRIYILFRAGDTDNVEEFSRDLHFKGVESEPGEALLLLCQLYKRVLHLECDEGKVIGDGNAGQISTSSSSLRSSMEYLRNAQVVRLRCLSSRDKYLVADKDKKTVSIDKKGPYVPEPASWIVEFAVNSGSALRLKSIYGKYLAASDEPSPRGMTGCLVLQSPHPDHYSEWEPEMRLTTLVKLRTHYGSFLCTDNLPCVTHDLPNYGTWDVEVVKRKEEGSATNIDDKASEEGSASNIDDKASSATKGRHETEQGSSVTKSPPGDSGLNQERDRVGYRYHFWELKKRLLDNDRRKNMLVRGGPGTTALVREVCADVREHFGTIAWISFPQKNDTPLIREEILLQLIFERVTFPKNFDRNPWMLRDHELLQQTARCIIVVDNLEDPKTLKKFKEIGGRVETCQVIFIDRPKKDLSDSLINQYGCEFETFKLEGLSYLPPGHYLKDYPENGLPSPTKEVYQLIVKKCQRLPTAIVFILRNLEEQSRDCSSKTIKDEWEARISLDNLSHELQVIQQVLKIFNKELHEDLHKDEGHKLDHIQQMLHILHTDNRRFCLLYLSILPQNRPISCKRVIRLWKAEKILADSTKPELFFDELLRRECIHSLEKRSDGELSTFQVDKRVREFIVCLSNLHDRVTITSVGRTERVRYLSILGKVRVLNEKFPLQSTFVLDDSSNWDKATTSKASPWKTSEAPLIPFNLENSRVLDLTGAPFQIVPDALFGLTDVRYLSLGNSSIKAIPGSIGKLKHLEFLDAKHSSVTKLPRQVGRLKKLRHIVIYHHERDPMMESYNLIGFKALCRVGGFKDLGELCFLEADETTLTDLRNLTKLRRLGITKLRKEHGGVLWTSLEKLKQLTSLNLHALDEDEIIDLPSSLPKDLSSSLAQNLKRLYLHGRLVKLPDWILSLHGLTRILLRWSQLEEDLLSTLGELSELVELQLHQAYNGIQMDFKDKQFPKLKILLLDELEGLRSVSLEQGTLPHLEILTISRCHWLDKMPSGIERIGKIQKLTFFDMSLEFYAKVRADHEKDDYEKFKHIPEVYFTRWRAGHWEPYQVESTDEAGKKH